MNVIEYYIFSGARLQLFNKYHLPGNNEEDVI